VAQVAAFGQDAIAQELHIDPSPKSRPQA